VSDTPDSRLSTAAARERAKERPGFVPRAAFILLLTSVAFLLLLYVAVGENYPLSEYFTVWPPLAWVTVLVPILLFTHSRSDRRLFIVGTLAVTALLLLTEEWVPLMRGLVPLRNQGGETIEVLTWNIDSAHGGKEKVLQHCAGADICFFQETPDGAGTFQDTELIGEWQGARWIDAGDCGVLSKYPIIPLRSRSVGPWSDPQVLRVDLPSSRSVILVNVRLMLPSLVLVPFGESWRRLAEENATRKQQFLDLAAFMKELADQYQLPVVLAGDFNTRAGSKLLAPLRQAGLRDLWLESGRGWGRTIIANCPMARIDQIWAAEEVRSSSCWVETAPISDHRLVRAILVLN